MILIPFNEYFIIPYVLWYLYVGLTIVYLMFKDRSEFLHCTFFLFAGTTACLLIFLILPSQVDFRPEITGSNIFTHIIALIFAMDNPTNVCPSIHVYAALVTHIVLTRSKHIPKSPWINRCLPAFCRIVCLSTVFLKQHSIIDGFWAAVPPLFVCDHLQNPACGYSYGYGKKRHNEKQKFYLRKTEHVSRIQTI